MIDLALHITPLEFGWDEVLMVCMGLAAAMVVYLDHRRSSETEDVLREQEGRLSRLEANSDDSVALEGRLSRVEAHVEVGERHEERLANTQERVARLELRLDDIDIEEKS